MSIRFLAAALLGCFLTAPVCAQSISGQDVSALQAAVDTISNTMVTAVAGVEPVDGNVTLPSSYSDTTCTNCTMVTATLNSPIITGSPTLNGNPLVTSVNGATGAITGLATTASLSNYATTASLSNYATTASLSNYATTASLSAYATVASLSGYATTSALSSVSTVANAAVKTVNSVAPVAGNVTLSIPTQYTDAMAIAANAPAIAAATSGLASTSYVTSAITAANPIKYAKTNLASNSSGVYTVTLPANLFVNSPTIQITPRASGIGEYVTTTGTAGTGFTVTVTFWKLAATITVLGGSITTTISSPVNFDMVAIEPTP